MIDETDAVESDPSGRPAAVLEMLAGDDHAGVLLTCEHASNRLPEPWVWPEADLRLVDTHWAVDLGIADVTRALARALGAPAVLARFTRLLCDANRAVGDPSMFRAVADGRPVLLNADLDDAEKQRRIERFHVPYHAAIDLALTRHPRAVVLSMHSFTSIYEGGPQRPMEIGVLFDEEEALSAALAEALSRQGWAVALNEPYSGKDGLIYAAARHAGRHGRRALELEIRQDVATDPARRQRLVTSLLQGLAHALGS